MCIELTDKGHVRADDLEWNFVSVQNAPTPSSESKPVDRQDMG